MPSIDTTDSIEIGAPAALVFATVLDYPRLHTWFPGYRCEALGVGEIGVGSRVHHTVRVPFVKRPTCFTRTVRRLTPPTLLEETYDEGDLIGRGIWTFERRSPESTVASFRCAVRSNTPLMHLGFALVGARGHSMHYRGLLRALKRHCEDIAQSGR